VVRKVLSYALGRGIQGMDRPAVDQIVAAVEKDGDKFSSVVLNVARSYPFQNARGSATAKGVPSAAAAPRLQPVSLQK
jgi:hypothetical protein